MRFCDSRHATCTVGGRTRIRSDSDFFQVMENQISRHVIDTQRVKVMILTYFPRFAENTDVPHMSFVDRLTHLSRHNPSFNRTVRYDRFSQTKFHDTTSITREILRYVKFHCAFPYVKLRGTTCIQGKIPWYVKFHCEFPHMKFYGTTCITREIPWHVEFHYKICEFPDMK